MEAARRFGRRMGMVKLVVIVATAGRPHLLSAQTASPSALFVVQSDDGDNRLQIDVLAQFDGRFALHDTGGAIVDTFAIRRFRPMLQGRLLRHFEFYFNPDFAGGMVVVQDAYFDTVFSKAFRLRVGKFKTPLGLERLMSANALTFMERALPTQLLPNRDIGVEVLGDLGNHTVSYMAAVMNGVSDFASADVDTNDDKELAGRVVIRPLARRTSSPMSGLAVGIAGSTGTVKELPVVKSSTLFQPFLSYVDATADGDRVHVSPQAFYYYKSIGVFGEFVRSAQSIRHDAASSRISHTAWEVSASYAITGEPVTDGAVRPRHDFDFGGGHVGAIQLAARYHTLHVDDDAFTLGLTAPGSSRSANAFTFGVNWYLNPFLKYAFNFERTVFDGDAGGPRPAENALAFRAQLFF